MGARVACHPQNFRTSRLAPADFEVLFTNWHLRALFYRTDGTCSFKFLYHHNGLQLSRQTGIPSHFEGKILQDNGIAPIPSWGDFGTGWFIYKGWSYEWAKSGEVHLNFLMNGLSIVPTGSNTAFTVSKWPYLEGFVKATHHKSILFCKFS